MDKNIQERIQRIVDEICGENKSEFCRRINRPNSAIKDIIGGKKTYPGYEIIYDILSSDLGISPSWLLLGEGEMLIREEPQPVANQSKLELSIINSAGAVIISEASALETMLTQVVDKIINKK